MFGKIRFIFSSIAIILFQTKLVDDVMFIWQKVRGHTLFHPLQMT